MPKLFQSNIFAWQLFQECSGQVITTGFGDILGIKFEAIDFLFDLYNIKGEWERQCLFEKLMVVDRIRTLSQRRETAKRIEQSKNQPRKRR